MSTSHFFSASRLVTLATSHWRAQLRHYLSWLLMCTIIAIPILGLYLTDMASGGVVRFTTDVQGVLYVMGLLVLGPVFASQHFGPMRHRDHALMVLMQPASVTEKWLLAALTVLLLFPLVYTLWFVLLVAPVAQLSFWWDMQVHVQAKDAAPHALNIMPLATDYAVYMPWRKLSEWRLSAFTAIVHLALTGLATTGSLLFKRAPFLLTLFTGFVVLLGSGIATQFSLAGGDTAQVLFTWVMRPHAHPTHSAPLAVQALNAWFWLCVPCLLWVCAWLALRERELT
jgi:hypothetical protein